MLDDFDGSQATGRRRLQRRPRAGRAAGANGPVLEPAIWAENMPFTETRDYVKKVLSNATLLRGACSTGRQPSLKARLGPSIGPRARRQRRDQQGLAMNEGLGAMSQPAMPRYTTSRSVLVLGGSGSSAAASARRLVVGGGGAGVRIAAPSRRPQRAATLRILPGVELSRADIHDDATLAQLVAGRDAVINLVGILHGDDAAFQRAHVELPRRLVRACRAAGVRRVVHVSALGAAPDAPSRYLRTKAAGEAVLRAPDLDADRAAAVGDVRRGRPLHPSSSPACSAVFPVLPLAGADARFQPVWVEDVGQAVVRCLGDRDTIGEIYECAGPQVYTPGRAGAAGRAPGRATRHASSRCPGALGRLQAMVMECLPGEPLISRDNLDSMHVPNVASGTLPGLQALGIQPASLESVMVPLLGGASGPRRFEPMRRHAGRA